MAKSKFGSDLEKEVGNVMSGAGIKYSQQTRIGNYPVDFHIKSANLSIQVDGCWHHFCSDCNVDKKHHARQKFQARRDKACNMYHKYRKVNMLRFRECFIKDNIEIIPTIIYNTIKDIKSGKLIFKLY